jgi:hypothetical protein
MDTNCLLGILGLTGALLGIVAMFLNYKAKFEFKHRQNKQKIKFLREKDNHREKQFNKLKNEVKLLKGGKKYVND